MSKPKNPAGAAIVVAPAPEASRQSQETAAEAGLPQTQPDAEADPEQEEEQATPPAFNPEAYAEFLAAQPAELFEQAFEVMLAEARNRGITGTEEDEPALAAQAAEPTEEAEPVAVDPDDEIRDLLRRNGLRQAWKGEDGNYHFDEKAAQAANATTVISL